MSQQGLQIIWSNLFVLDTQDTQGRGVVTPWVQSVFAKMWHSVSVSVRLCFSLSQSLCLSLFLLLPLFLSVSVSLTLSLSLSFPLFFPPSHLPFLYPCFYSLMESQLPWGESEDTPTFLWCFPMTRSSHLQPTARRQVGREGPQHQPALSAFPWNPKVCTFTNTISFILRQLPSHPTRNLSRWESVPLQVLLASLRGHVVLPKLPPACW